MVKHFNSILIAGISAIIVLVSCTAETDFNDRLTNLEDRVSKLEKLCAEMNTNISSLQGIVSALQNQDYITAVNELTSDGKVIGYTINFAKGQPITIYHGKDGADGKDGSTPVIGVKQDTDGIWYWTLNGEWLLDDNGQKIKAVGTDGKDGQNGKDGIAPQLKIEDGYWYISYDNGTSWTKLDKVVEEDGKDGVDGVDGDSMFQSVTVTETEVTFVTSDGQTFVLERASALSIEFDTADLVVMAVNSTREIHYIITSSIDDITIEAIGSADIKAKVVKTDAKTGTIQVKTGATIDEYSKVVVLVSNGSQAIMRTLNFEKEAIEVEEKTTKEVTDEGGEVTLEFFSNTPCHAVIPDDARSWISVAPETKGMERQTIRLIVQPNTGTARSATVIIQSEDGSIVLPFLIEQQQKPASKALLPYAFLPNEIDKTTITEAYFHIANPTTTATIISAGDSEYEPIYFEMIGTAAHFYTTGQVYYCSAFQSSFEGWESIRCLDLSMFDVSDSYSMSQAFMDCYNLQSIDLSSFDTGNVLYFSNMFNNCRELRELDLTNFDTAKAIDMYGMFNYCQNLRSLNVSGFDTSSVTDLGFMFYKCSSLKQLDISSWNVSSCTNFHSMFSWCVSLKQLDVSSWETPACERINSMFCNCHSLESLDVSHFDISKVIDLNGIFSGCWDLQTIDISNWDTSNVGYTRSMFADCNKLRAINLKEWDFREIIMMDGMFMNCYSLESIVLPDTETPKLQNMDNAFMDCSSLKTITFNGLSTSNVTSMRELFAACSSLSTLDLSSFNTSKVTSMFGMFEGCSNLKDINLSSFDTRNVTDMDYMFSKCYLLSSLNLSSFETTNIQHANDYLQALYNLSKLDLGDNDWSSVDLSNSFYRVAERANQCHIRCSVDTKNKIISVRNEMKTDPKYVWYVPEDNLPDNVDGRDPNLYYSSDFTRDGTVFVKQVAIEGNGIDIVFMGDGFSDRLIADGTYDNAMNNVIDAIFSEEPFKSFKNLFNIYIVYAVSENEVIGKNTTFMSYDRRQGWAGAIGAYDTPKIWAYANLASEKGDFREVIPIVILNSTTSDGAVWTTTYHAGVNDYYLDPEWDDYHGGQSIAYISGPFTSDISYTAIHEMGHAFGKLADEYVSGYGTINQDVLDMWAPLCIYGMNKNIDFTGDSNSVKWHHFLNDDRYSGESLGCYEGAAQFNYGVWRSTDNSIMRDDANGHFNAPSREAIYYRINKLAYGKNWNYRFEDFVQWDLKNIPHAAHAPAPDKRAFSGNVNRKHIFKMEESITEDGKKLITIIQN